MVALALNPVMPAFGFLIAAALVIASGAWSAGEKLVALLLPPLIFASAACSSWGSRPTASTTCSTTAASAPSRSARWRPATSSRG